MTTLGMDVDAIRALADRLDGEAQRIQHIIGVVDGIVRRSSADWHGSVAQRFASEWYGRFKPTLERAYDSVAGLASSARDNARDQDAASGVTAVRAVGSVVPGGSFPPRDVFQAMAARVGGSPGFVSSLFAGAPGENPALGGRPLSAWWSQAFPSAAAGQAQTWGSSAAVSAHGFSDLAGVPVSGEAHASAYTQASESTHANISLQGADAGFAAAAGIGVAAAVGGQLGTHDANLSGNADASVAARANADGDVRLGLDGAEAKLDGNAFVGASVDASASGHLTGVDATAGVHGYAGLGAHADLSASVDLHEIKASVDLGVALGLGGGVKFSIDAKPEEVLNALPHWW